MHLWVDFSAVPVEIPFCLFPLAPLWRVLDFSQCVKTSKGMEFCFCGCKTHLKFNMCWVTAAQWSLRCLGTWMICAREIHSAQPHKCGKHLPGRSPDLTSKSTSQVSLTKKLIFSLLSFNIHVTFADHTYKPFKVPSTKLSEHPSDASLFLDDMLVFDALIHKLVFFFAKFRLDIFRLSVLTRCNQQLF